MSSSTKRKRIIGFPFSCKNWKNKFFFAGENWCLASHSLGSDIHIPTRFVTLGRLFFCTLYVSGRHLFGSLTLFILSDSWGLIKRLDDDPLFKVEIGLVNSSTCHDLLSSTNLVGSRLVDVAAGMNNKILSAMSKKRTRRLGDFSNPPIP